MTALAALSFIIFNLLLGLSGIYIVRVFLFHPSKKWYIGETAVPFTPGFVFRKKEYLIRKAYQLLEHFLRECHNYDYEGSITKLERKLYNHVLESLANLDEVKHLPRFLAAVIRKAAAQISYEVFRQFIRSFIPFLIEKYEMESYIELINAKLSVYVIRDYYLRYVHRYLVYTFGIVFFLLGLFNMIVFLIVR